VPENTSPHCAGGIAFDAELIELDVQRRSQFDGPDVERLVRCSDGIAVMCAG
jgi:hypothetical protein